MVSPSGEPRSPRDVRRLCEELARLALRLEEALEGDGGASTDRRRHALRGIHRLLVSHGHTAEDVLGDLIRRHPSLSGEAYLLGAEHGALTSLSRRLLARIGQGAGDVERELRLLATRLEEHRRLTLELLERAEALEAGSERPATTGAEDERA